MNKREVGSSYEIIAGKYLELQGYTVLEYNFRCKTGEIDIVARDGEYLVFCEVKFRKNTCKGNPFEAITYAKQKKISQVAFYYMTVHDCITCPVRFDVVGILGNEINLIKNAFEFAG